MCRLERQKPRVPDPLAFGAKGRRLAQHEVLTRTSLAALRPQQCLRIISLSSKLEPQRVPPEPPPKSSRRHVRQMMVPRRVVRHGEGVLLHITQRRAHPEPVVVDAARDVYQKRTPLFYQALAVAVQSFSMFSREEQSRLVGVVVKEFC